MIFTFRLELRRSVSRSHTIAIKDQIASLGGPFYRLLLQYLSCSSSVGARPFERGATVFANRVRFSIACNNSFGSQHGCQCFYVLWACSTTTTNDSGTRIDPASC